MVLSGLPDDDWYAVGLAGRDRIALKACRLDSGGGVIVKTVQSTERLACSPVRHRVMSMSPAAQSDAVIRFMVPVAFTRTIRNRITAAIQARS